jgi:cytochrome P450
LAFLIEARVDKVRDVKTLDQAPFLDILTPEFLDAPLPVIEHLKQESGVVRTAIGAMMIRRNLVVPLLSDKRLRSSLVDTIVQQGLSTGSVVVDIRSHSLLASEGDVHQQLRGLVSRSFTPHAIDQHKSMMREILESVAAPALERRQCDFMAEIANQYPIRVMCRLLRVPDDHHKRFMAWNDGLSWLLSAYLASHREEAEQAMTQLDAYAEWLVDERRREPQDDLMSPVVQAGEGATGPSELQLRSLVGSLLMGFDSTRNQLGLAMALFAEHPDQWALLAERPDLIPNAIDEVTRFAGAVRSIPRVALEDLEVDGYAIECGQLLALPIGLVNHDPAAYHDPEAFDITAQREAPLSFGRGQHYCLGVHLAKAILDQAFRMLPSRMRNLALAGEPTWRSPLGTFGPITLPLRFD